MTLKVLAMAAAITGLSASAAEAAAACSVEVSFESVCCGVDRRAYADVKAFLEASPLAMEPKDHAWGMEGEQTLCARTRSDADAETLFGQIKARLSAGARAGYITVSVGGKERLKVRSAPRVKGGPK